MNDFTALIGYLDPAALEVKVSRRDRRLEARGAGRALGQLRRPHPPEPREVWMLQRRRRRRPPAGLRLQQLPEQAPRLGARKVLGWPKICKLARAFL